VHGESEFITISYWEDVQAMARFAGADPTGIHHLERDPEFLIEPLALNLMARLVPTGSQGYW
jgi:hypothetical protein